MNCLCISVARISLRPDECHLYKELLLFLGGSKAFSLAVGWTGRLTVTWFMLLCQSLHKSQRTLYKDTRRANLRVSRTSSEGNIIAGFWKETFIYKKSGHHLKGRIKRNQGSKSAVWVPSTSKAIDAFVMCRCVHHTWYLAVTQD